jgi:predicted O-methyltransferase YrrM
MDLKYIVAGLAVSFISMNSVHSSWEPGHQLKFKERLRVYNNESPQLDELRNSVSKWLVGSWCSQEKGAMLMDMVLLLQPRVTVEVGVFAGASLVPLAVAVQHAKCGKTYAIDDWNASTAVQYMEGGNDTYRWWSTLNMDPVREQSLQAIRTWQLQNSVTVIKAPSVAAVSNISDEIDLLHLDGDFTEKGSLDDFDAYFPKLKVGGGLIITNAIVNINNKFTKMKCVQKALDHCDLVGASDNDNSLFFIKTRQPS